MIRIKKKQQGRICWRVTALILLIMATGCNGITPFQPDNHREEGPANGLFTGSTGELTVSPIGQ